jgi:GNAT superfamily N-acetyltransferase
VTHILDNPIWHTLIGPHRQFSLSCGDTLWFAKDVAPFIAVANEAVSPALDEAREAGMGERAYFVGVLPKQLPPSWHYAARSRILQMVPPTPASERTTARAQALGLESREAMYQLAQAAFPDFFRRRTAELGLYLGMFTDGKLVAMAGERIRLPQFQEISGVCTHPDFVGRGHARALTLDLLERHRQRGVRSFLHVSEGNSGARRLYETMGFPVRADLELGLVERREAAGR